MNFKKDKELDDLKKTLDLYIKIIDFKNQTIDDLEKIIDWDASTHESKDKIIDELQSEASLLQNNIDLLKEQLKTLDELQSDTDILKTQLSAMNSWCQYYSNMYSALYAEYSKLLTKENTSTEAQTNLSDQDEEALHVLRVAKCSEQKESSLLEDIMSMIKGIYNKCDSIDERTRRIEQTDQNPHWNWH